MNESDLIKFDIPPIEVNNENNTNTSPGRNPFDVLSQKAEDSSLTNYTEVQIIDDDFKTTTDFLNLDKEVFDLSGRESLGILNLDSLNCNFFRDDSNGSNNDLVNELNTAFRYPYSGGKRFSYISSNSSVSVTPSFLTSGSLEASELWRTSVSSIYRCNYSSLSQEGLNNGFFVTNTTDGLSDSKNVLNNGIIATNSTDGSSDFKKFLRLDNVEGEEHKRSTLKSRDSDRHVLVCLEEETDDEFNDSVFIEAHHFASKLKTGCAKFTSIEDDQLDNTQPPEFVDINEDEEIQDPVDVKVEVFSKIDKMIPPPLVNGHSDILNPESENVDAAPCDKNNFTDKSTAEIKQNISNIFRNKSENVSRFSFSRGSSCSSSKDAKEILQNLSEIINNECKDPKQNWEGQQLIADLAGIICSDVQLSETAEQSVENCEPLDLTTKSTRSNDEQALNLSIKKLVHPSAPKALSQSFSFSTPLPPSKLLTNIKSKKIASTGSLDCDRDRSGSDLSKLKPKKIDEKSFDKKKGPLKAVIPVGNMSKSKDISLSRQSLNTDVSTPPKVDLPQTNSIRYKRTSTPISGQLKPIAQSTPDNTRNLSNSSSSTSQLRRPSFCSPVSPLVKPNSPKVSSTNKSMANPSPNNSKPESLSESQNFMYRRHSTTELNSNNNVLPKLKRNSSVGKSFKVSSEINKAKENLSPLKNFIKKATSVHKNRILQDKNNCISKTMKTIKSVRF